jgi:hypothetical protein
MKTKNLLINIMFATIVLLAGCEKDTFVENIGECPVVLSTNPDDQDVNVPRDQIITITFNEDLRQSTITNESIMISSPSGQISGVLSYANKVVTFTPTVRLATNTKYTGTVKTSVLDTDGNAIQSDYVWSFTTVLPVLPVVTATDPLNLATAVPLNKIITATFSKAMNPLTITGANVTISANGNAIAGVVTYANNVVTFTPTLPLASNTVFTGKINKNVADTENNNMAADYFWTFTTLQVIPPTVTSTDPQNAATNVALNKIIKATFSKAMNAATITGANVTVSANGNAIAGLVTYANNVATFTPATNLLSNTVYTGKISQNVTDTDGTKMVNDFTWTFTTVQIIPPTVTSTDPQNTATNVALNKTITATFSKAMNAATITGANVTVSANGNAIAGVVTYSNNVATFNPTANLLPNTVYTGRINQNVTDTNGTKMVNDYTWTFTTVQPTAPTVISTDPQNLATGVALNKTISATFSEAMNPLTITTTSFTLSENGNPIAGVVIPNGNMATFNPNANLLAGKTYTATITTAAKNLAGTSLQSNYVWTFSTNAAAAGPATINLDCVGSFSVIAGSTVTNTGPTIVTGNLGLSPGSAVTGFPPGTVVNGAIKINDTEANNAKNCLTAAYNDAAGRSLNVIVMANGELGGLTLAPGLYKAPNGSFDITSVDLTLDAQGNPNAVWIFQMPSSTLTVGNGVKITLAGGASAKNIFWQVGSSATIGTTAQMKGTIMADQSVTLKNGAILIGRALSRIGAVTLDNNTVTIPQ